MDLDGGEWRYTVTKTNTPHIVPLSSQAVAILRELKPLTGRGRYVFSSGRSSQRPMSDMAILAAMRRMGIACNIARNIIESDMRMVLDTDVLVAAFRSERGASRQLLIAALDERFDLS